MPAAEPQAEKPCDEKSCVEPSHAGEQHTKKPHAEKPRAEEPHASKPMKILKRPTNELPELLPHLLPSTQGVSKVVNTLKVAEPNMKKPSTIPQKNKPSSIPPRSEMKVTDQLNAKDESNAKYEAKVEDRKTSVDQPKSDKPLDLAFVGGAPFIRLAKSKKLKHRAEIFAISMRDIKYQLNKGTKPPTNPKTVVPAEYHDFFDVFLKDISDTLRPYGKYDHKIELLKDKELSDLGHSALRGMSISQLEFVKKFLEERLK